MRPNSRGSAGLGSSGGQPPGTGSLRPGSGIGRKPPGTGRLRTGNDSCLFRVICDVDLVREDAVVITFRRLRKERCRHNNDLKVTKRSSKKVLYV
jgi:hypothetical protein